MPKLTDYVTQAATVAGEAEALFALYETLEPSAKTFLATEFQKVVAEFGTIKTAVDNFKTASWVGKVGGAVAVLSSVLDVGTFATSLLTDGERFFGTAWPQALTHLNNILTAVGIKPLALGQPAPAAAGLISA